MIIIKKFRARIENGKLLLEKSNNWQIHLNSLNGKKVWLSVVEQKHKRSLKQNSYYWAYLKIIEDESGHDSKDLHEYFKKLFLPCHPVDFFGLEVELCDSSTKLDVNEFTDYIKKIEQLTEVPAPNPADYYN